MAADAARPYAAARLIGRGIGRCRHERAALLGQKGGADVADRAADRRARCTRRNRQRADIGDEGCTVVLVSWSRAAWANADEADINTVKTSQQRATHCGSH